MVDMAHFAGLVAAGRAPDPGRRTRDIVTTTLHKTLGGPRAGMILCRAELAKTIDSRRVPGPCRAVRSSTSSPPRPSRCGSPPAELFRERQRQVIVNAARSPTGCWRGRRRVVTGGTDIHLVLVDLRGTELDGRGRRGPPARDRHHGQPQRDPVRPASADGHLGAAHRHARDDHARPAGRRLPRDRPRSSARALAPDFERPPRGCASASARSPIGSRSTPRWRDRRRPSAGTPRPSRLARLACFGAAMTPSSGSTRSTRSLAATAVAAAAHAA